MAKFWRRDWLAARWYWLLLTLFYVIYNCTPSWDKSILALFTLPLGPGLAIILLILDDRYKTESYFLCLPLSRNQLVRARYILFLLLSVASAALFWLYYLLIKNLFRHPVTHPASGISTPVFACIILLLMLLLLSLFLPFYFRFGLVRSLYILTAMSLSLGALLLVAAKFVASLIEMGQTAIHHWGAWPILTGTGMLVAGFYCISARIAIWAYNTRGF